MDTTLRRQADDLLLALRASVHQTDEFADPMAELLEDPVRVRGVALTAIATLMQYGGDHPGDIEDWLEFMRYVWSDD